jgi:hypothetical protein
LLGLLVAAAAPGASAQAPAYADKTHDHVEAGVYGNFFRLNDQNIDFGGLGGRAGFNINPYVQIEAEMSYDFKRAFPETFTNGATFSVVDSNVRVLHGLFGPKFQTNRGPVRLFLTVKGGFDEFLFDSRPASFGTFASSVQNLRAGNVKAALYPGVGGEAFWGPLGLRLDAGDEIYIANGARNNLRIAFGPTIRF